MSCLLLAAWGEPSDRWDPRDDLDETGSTGRLRVGPYELIAELGRGGMGVVWRARHRQLDRQVALKLVHGAQVALPEFLDRFRVEAEAAARLDHPNIVPIYEIGDHHGQPYLALRLIEGRPLDQWIRERPAVDESFRKDRERETALLVSKLARAVHHAHQRCVLHRDLKPANVLVDAEGEPHLTDFGLAKVIDRDHDLTGTLAVFGTPAYLSPEQASGRSEAVTTATDVYGLGAILYELLCGTPPFQGATSLETIHRVAHDSPRRPSVLQPRVDRDLETICLRCLEKEPRHRYGSAAALMEDLDRWLRLEPIVARPAGVLETVAKWSRRHPARAALVATILVAMVVVVTLSTTLGLRIAREAERTRQQVVRLHLAEGHRQFDDGDPAFALLHFVEALRLDLGDPAREGLHRRRIGMALDRSPRVTRWIAHTGAVNVALFDPSGRRLASVGDDGTARIWDAASGRAEGPALLHPGPVTTAAFDPAGERLATTSEDGTAHLWDPATGREIIPAVPANPFQFKRPSTPAIAFHPNGRHFVHAEGRQAIVRETATGKVVGFPFEHTSRVLQATFDPTGKHLLVVGDDGESRLWDVDHHRVLNFPLRLPLARPGEWCGGWFGSGGTRIVTACDAGESCLWDARTGARVASLAPESRSRLIQAGFSPDGRFAFTGSYDKGVRLWDANQGVAVGAPLPVEGELQWLAFSRDGQRLAFASLGGTVRLQPIGGNALDGPVLHHTSFVFFADFSPDGRTLVTATQSGLIERWDLRDNAPRYRFGTDGKVVVVGFSPDGASAFAADTGGTVRWWNTTSWKPSRPVWHAGVELLHAALDSSGKRMAVACADRTARILDPNSGFEIVKPLPHGAPVRRVAFSPDGSLLLTLTLSNDPQRSAAQIWDVSTGTARSAPILHPDWLDAGEFSPDGHRFLTACADGQVRIYDATTSRIAAPPLRVGGFIQEAHFSPDGRMLLAARTDHTYEPRAAGLFDTTSGHARVRYTGHRDGVRQAVFSPDGTRVATGSEDSTVRLWNSQTGKELTPPLRYSGKPTCLAFSADGSLLAAACADGTARIWDGLSGDPISPVFRHEGAIRTIAFSRDARIFLTGGEDGSVKVWDLSPSTDSWEELEHRARWVSACRLDAAGHPVPLERESLLRTDSAPPTSRVARYP